MGIADELITRGLARENFRDEYGGVCLRKAAMLAYPGAYDKAYDVLRGLVPPCPKLGLEPVAWFNDHQPYDKVLRVAKEADEILDGMQ